MSDKIYNHTEYTEITQYNAVEANTFLGWKKYVPVFHWLQKRPWDDNPIEYHEGHVEIGGPTDTPIDIEMYDDEILASSWKERPIHPDAISVSPTTWTVKIGKTLQLSAVVTPSWSEFPIDWRSSDTSKATVSSTGKVTWVAEWDNIKITARSWAVESFATIKVEKVPVKSVSIDATKSMTAGDTFKFEAEVLPADATYKGVTWGTSNDTIVSISADWEATALAAWEATITVTSVDDSTKSATCVVTVTESSNEPEEP